MRASDLLNMNFKLLVWTKLQLTFDSKLYFLNDNNDTLPFKHYLTLEDAFMNQILLEDEWEGSGDTFSQSSDNTLPDVDTISEDNFVVPDQGYKQWKYSHREISTNLAGSS